MYKDIFLKSIITLLAIFILASCDSDIKKDSENNTGIYENNSSWETIIWPVQIDKKEILKELPENKIEVNNKENLQIEKTEINDDYSIKWLNSEVTRYLEKWKEDIKLYIKNWLRKKWWFYFMWKLNCYYSPIITKDTISIPSSKDKTCINSPKIVKAMVLSCKENNSKEYEKEWYEIKKITEWNEYFFYNISKDFNNFCDIPYNFLITLDKWEKLYTKVSIDEYNIKKYNIINEIENNNKIIDNLKIRDIELKRISNIIENKNKDKYLYVLSEFSGDNNIDWKYTCYWNSYCTIVYFNKEKNKNTILYIWNSQEIFPEYNPKFTFNNGVILNNIYAYPYNLDNFNEDKTDRKSLEKITYNNNSRKGRLYNIYYLDSWNLAIEDNYNWLNIYTPNSYIYEIKNNENSDNILFNYPYYKIKEDLEEIKETKEFKNTKDDVQIEDTDENYLESELNKKSFNLYAIKNNYDNSIYYMKLSDDIIDSPDNKVIFQIKNINPKSINFSFLQDINMWNTSYQIFQYSYNNNKWYYIYDLKKDKWAILNELWEIKWWKSNNIIIIWEKEIDIALLNFSELITI